jgi:hypothetical protein
VLSVSDSEGRPLPIKPDLLRARPESLHIFIDPGQMADAMVLWRDWCRPSPGTLRLTVSVPGFEEPQHVDIGGGPSIPCTDPSSRDSILGIGAFVNLGFDVSSAQGRLRLRLELPDEVAEGTTLHFVVAITNPSSAEARLDPCPAYQVSLFDPGEVRERYRLNCQPAGRVIGGERTVRFAMEVRVPPSFLDRIERKLRHPVQRWRATLEWAFLPTEDQAADSHIWIRSR